jgi:mono/diheme cytochrome c family protein
MSRFKLAVCVALLGMLGCRGQTSREEPLGILRNMWSQPRYDAQSFSAYYPDHRTMRTPVAGTVAREMEISPPIAEGRTEDDSGFVETIPAAVIERAGGMQQLLARGESRYDIYCTPCHDGLGTGKGMVIERAQNQAFQPPSLHEERIRTMPDGQLYQTVTYGFNNMPAYGSQLPVDDRWSVVGYVRALQLSQSK